MCIRDSAAFTALAHYLTELAHLEQELSMSARLVSFTPELGVLADGCQEAPRADEPYRRALRVIRGRLTSTATEILDRQPPDGLDLGLPPYSTPAELRADLDTIDVSLRTHGSSLLADRKSVV